MNSISVIIIVIIIILIICIIGSVSYSSCQDSFKRKRQRKFMASTIGMNQFYIPGYPAKFTNAPDQSGWQLYMRKGCGYCTKQKAQNGNKFSNYIEYAPGGTIIENKIAPGQPVLPFSAMSGFPMWYNYKTGAKKMGLTDMCSLSPTISGCTSGSKSNFNG